MSVSLSDDAIKVYRYLNTSGAGAEDTASTALISSPIWASEVSSNARRFLPVKRYSMSLSLLWEKIRYLYEHLDSGF